MVWNYRVGRKQRLVMGRVWAGGVGGGGDLLNEGETGWQQQYEGEGCSEWKTNENREQEWPGLIQENQNQKPKKVFKDLTNWSVWLGSDSGSTQVRGSISPAIRSISPMQSLQYNSWSMTRCQIIKIIHITYWSIKPQTQSSRITILRL